MTGHTFRSRPMDLAVDTIGENDLERVIDWLREYPRLTMADETRRFEEAWAKWLGVKYAVFCNSGSSADLLMYAALDSSGRAGNRKVIVPATGWVTTVAPAMQLGFEPTMCETDPMTFGMDAAYLETFLEKERPDSIILVHELGVPNNMGPILELQKKYDFNLMEDCCASHGARHQGQMVGTFGDMSSFSFYYGHHMSTIEGGMVCTDDEELYYHLLMLRSHGWCKDLPKEEYAKLVEKHGIDDFHSPFTFLIPGYNLRSTDLNAFVGLIQLEHLDEIVEKRINNHLIYQELIGDKMRYAKCLPGDVISSISFCAIAESSEQRKHIVSVLNDNEIDTRLFTAANLGKHPFWKARYGEFTGPVASTLYDCGFFLPNNQAISRSDIEHICEVVLNAVS